MTYKEKYEWLSKFIKAELDRAANRPGYWEDELSLALSTRVILDKLSRADTPNNILSIDVSKLPEGMTLDTLLSCVKLTRDING